MDARDPPKPYTVHPTPYTVDPTPYALHPTPYTLHPTPYALRPTLYTLHPTPYTLHPTPDTRVRETRQPEARGSAPESNQFCSSATTPFCINTLTVECVLFL